MPLTKGMFVAKPDKHFLDLTRKSIPSLRKDPVIKITVELDYDDPKGRLSAEHLVRVLGYLCKEIVEQTITTDTQS